MTLLKAITEVCKKDLKFKEIVKHPLMDSVSKEIVQEFNENISEIMGFKIDALGILHSGFNGIKWAEVRIIQQIIFGESIRNAAKEVYSARKDIISIIKKFEHILESTLVSLKFSKA